MGLFSRKKKTDEHPEFDATFCVGELAMFDDNNRLMKTSFSKVS